jgi:type I restriction enzyme S subunit
MSSDFVFNKEYPLSDLVEFVNEKIDSTKISLDTYISTDNMITDRGGVETATKLPSATKFHHFKPTDTLFSNIRTYFRKVWFAEFEGGASPDVLVFRTKEPKVLDPAYLFYLLSDKKFSEYTVLTSKGAKMPRGDKAAIMQYTVFVPEPNVQRTISSALRTYDLKLKANTKINQTLEHLAQAIFKSWFVDFDPIKAKIETLATGGSADDAELAAMSIISAKPLDELNGLKASNPEAFNKLAQTAALFPAAMQDSEFGEIPEGWEVKPFKKVIDKYVDNRGKTPPIVENGIPLVEVKHLPENSAFPNLNTEKRVTEETYKTWFRVHVEPKDILISTVGTIGRTSFIKSTNFGIAQNVLGLRFAKAIEPEYMFYTIKSHRFQHDMTARLVTTVQSSIKRKDLDTIDILVPKPSIQIAFCEFVEPLIDEQFVNNTQNNDLAIIRDTLLPKLLSGEIDLTNEVVE